MLWKTSWLLCCLSTNLIVFAPPAPKFHRTRSLENLSRTASLSLLRIRHSTIAQPVNQTLPTPTDAHYPHHDGHFDINAYRSSWKFIDKTTLRVRFRLHESLVRSIQSSRFLVRHIQTGHVRTYDEPHEIINATFTLYLHDIKHGRHTVCLLLDTSKPLSNPKHIFCQDIVFNFHKYGHHDLDADDYRNTFIFLLTQYAIVSGILFILQLVHAARKRRLVETLYDKANALRHTRNEHHHRPGHDSKSASLEKVNRTGALNYLIYNLNRSQLYTTDDNEMHLINDPSEVNHGKVVYEKQLRLPNRYTNASAPLLASQQSMETNENLDFDPDTLHIAYFDDSDFDTRSYEEQSLSFKSVSHILEASKPWLAKIADDGSVKHSLLDPSQTCRARRL